MNIEKYIETGIIEAYVMGITNPVEREEFEQVLSTSPALQQALLNFELKIEDFAMRHSVPPPPGTWEMIEDRIRELPVIRPPHRKKGAGSENGNGKGNGKHEDFIPIQEASSSHIRVHRYWRIVFIAIFILSKIFLALSIYYFVEYRHARTDIQQLHQQLLQRTSQPPR